MTESVGITTLTKAQRTALEQARSHTQHPHGLVVADPRVVRALWDKGLAHATTTGWGMDGPITQIVLNDDVMDGSRNV